MIFELIVGVFAALLEGIASLLGDIPAPAWLTGISGDWQALVGGLNGLGAWIPWALMRSVILAILACLGISLAIKLTRIVLSLFTGGGGSAA